MFDAAFVLSMTFLTLKTLDKNNCLRPVNAAKNKASYNNGWHKIC